MRGVPLGTGRKKGEICRKKGHNKTEGLNSNSFSIKLNLQSLKENLKDLIAKSKTNTAIQQLLEITKEIGDPELEEEVLLQSARYEAYTKAKRQGTSAPEEQQLTIARIHQALLQIISELPENRTTRNGRQVRDVADQPKGRPWWQWVVGLSVIISILGGIAEFSGINLLSLFGAGATDTSLQLTVYVHGPKGRQNIVLDNKGTLIADFGNRRDTRRIGEDGRTNFGEIDRRFLGKEIGLFVKADGFEVADPDTVYVYDGNPIYLAVQRPESMGLITGLIRDENENGLAGVTILIEQDTLTQTDDLGRFRLNLPKDKIQESYRLTVQKDGYQTKSRTYYPNSSLFEVALERVKNQ